MSKSEKLEQAARYERMANDYEFKGDTKTADALRAEAEQLRQEASK